MRVYPKRGRLNMINRGSTTITHQRQPILLDADTIALEPYKPENNRVVLECPRCCWIFEPKKPNRQHTNCSFNKPQTNKTNDTVIEEPRVCRNPKCKKQFTIYWYKPLKAPKS